MNPDRVTNRATNRLVSLATLPLCALVLVQNARTGRARVLTFRDIAEFGVVGAWRRNNQRRDWARMWQQRGGPPISSLLRTARKARKA